MGKLIPLTQGKFAIVDDCNYEWLNKNKWYAHWNKDTQSFYAVRNGKTRDGKKEYISMARKILGLNKGDLRQSDHKNHNTLDNRCENLIIATHSQNQWNRKNPKGYYQRGRNFRAQIGVNNKLIYLGTFGNAIQARKAYLAAKKQYHNL